MAKERFGMGNTDMAAKIAAFDWASTSLGPRSGWPLALQSCVRLCLAALEPMAIGWGPELLLIPNDAYSDLLAGVVDSPLGKPAEAIWRRFSDSAPRLIARARDGLDSDPEEILFREGFHTQAFRPLRETAGLDLGGESGAVTGICHVLKASTARMREEAARRVEAERLRMELLFEKAPALIAHLSGPRHVFRFANAFYRGIVTPRTLVGLPFREAMPELGPGVYDVLDRVYRTGETDVVREMPVRIRRAETGQLEDIYVHFVNQAVRDEHGEIEGILCHGFEVTEQVRARLEAERLAGARQETVNALEERAAFEQQLIGIVSHDLRNPLQASLLGAQMLLRLPSVGPTERSLASRIQSSVARALRMISDLLDFTQARVGGGIAVRPSEVDLRKLADQVLQELRLNNPDRRLELSSEGDVRGRWDSDRLAQVIENLVSNAIHHGAEGTEVRVRADACDGQVALAVHNQGPAIPPSLLERLFQPMVRGSERPDRGRNGLGLGLYITRHVVEAHGGTIEVRSTEPEGTRFTVRLPRECRGTSDPYTPDDGSTARPGSGRVHSEG